MTTLVQTKADMFKFILKLLGYGDKVPDLAKLDRSFAIDKDLPEGFDIPVYVVGYVEGRGHRVLQLDYTQRKDV